MFRYMLRLSIIPPFDCYVYLLSQFGNDLKMYDTIEYNDKLCIKIKNLETRRQKFKFHIIPFPWNHFYKFLLHNFKPKK